MSSDQMFVCVSRSNLDPFNQYSEEQVWDALERSHMKECVSLQTWRCFHGDGGTFLLHILQRRQQMHQNHVEYLMWWRIVSQHFGLVFFGKTIFPSRTIETGVEISSDWFQSGAPWLRKFILYKRQLNFKWGKRPWTLFVWVFENWVFDENGENGR